MGEVKEPYEGGTGSLLEVVDMMCDVTEKLADIVKKTGCPDRAGRGSRARSSLPIFRKKENRQKMILDRIEMKLRRI